MKGRDSSLDLMKGILIVLVVLGHAYSYEYGNTDCWHKHVFNLIYTFHMPLFVMLCGYFFHSCLKRSLVENIKNKFKRLILPWLVMSSITAVSFFLSRSCVPAEYGLISFFSQVYIIFVSLWFLPCIFCLTFFYYVVVKMRTNVWYLCSGILLLLFFLYYLIKLSFVGYSTNVLSSFLTHCQIIRQTIVFGLGILLFRFKDQMKPYHWIIINLNALLGMITVRVFYGIWISEYSFSIRIIDGICCSIVAYSILKPLCDWAVKYTLSRAFVFCGVNSLGIYCVHHVLFYFIKWNNLLPVSHNNFSCILFFLGLMATTIVFILFFKKLFKSKSYILGI